MPTREQYEIAMKLIKECDRVCLLTCEEVSAILTAAGRGGETCYVGIDLALRNDIAVEPEKPK